MTQFTKLKTAQLEVGEIYVAYSGRNKMLSSNGNRGRLVKLVKKSAEGATFTLLGTEETTAITRVDTREDAWIYSPAGADLKVAVIRDDNANGPKFSPRMVKEGWDGKPFIFNAQEMYTSTRADELYYNVPMLRHKGDTIKPETGQPYINNFVLACVVPVEAPEWRIPRAERMGLGAIELPLPKKPVPPESMAVIEALMSQLKHVATHGGSNVSFIKVDEKFKTISNHMNQGCHYSAQEGSSRPTRWLVTLGYNKGYPDKAKLPEVLEYINYIANYSPYADVILTKDPQFIYDHGYVIDGSASNKLVIGACFCTRQVWEKPYRAQAYYALLQAGVQPDAAFLFGGQCSQFNAKGVKFTLTEGNHNHFQNVKASNKDYIAFLKKTPAHLGEPYMKNPRASSDNKGIDGMWSTDFGSQGTSDLYTKLANIKRSGGSPMDNAMKADDAIEMAADIIDDWMGKHGFM